MNRVDPSVTASVFAQEKEAAGGVDMPVLIGSVKEAVVNFTRVDKFTTFLAEFAVVGDDLVFHFFPPREKYVSVPGTDKLRVDHSFLPLWQRKFPEVLSPVAESYFRATKPRLVAQYAPEFTSWWMRAGGFAQRLDPAGYSTLFLSTLDAALDAASFLPSGS